MNNFLSVGKNIVRKDGVSKATGELKYMLDHQFADVLYTKILYPPFFRANIVKVDTEKAEKSDDVLIELGIPLDKCYGDFYMDMMKGKEAGRRSL